MAVYIKAPKVPDWDSLEKYKSVYLAGGLAGPYWRREMFERLAGTDLVLLNPVNGYMDHNCRYEVFRQIAWEHTRMRESAAILFWLPKESICPISLYELGYWLATEDESGWQKHVFIGLHPEYEKRQDVEIRVGIVRNDIEIVYSLADLAEQVFRWAEEN